MKIGKNLEDLENREQTEQLRLLREKSETEQEMIVFIDKSILSRLANSIGMLLYEVTPRESNDKERLQNRLQEEILLR